MKKFISMLLALFMLVLSVSQSVFAVAADGTVLIQPSAAVYTKLDLDLLTAVSADNSKEFNIKQMLVDTLSAHPEHIWCGYYFDPGEKFKIINRDYRLTKDEFQQVFGTTMNEVIQNIDCLVYRTDLPVYGDSEVYITFKDGKVNHINCSPLSKLKKLNWQCNEFGQVIARPAHTNFD